MTEFERDAFTECKKLILHVIHGSAAENYAKTNKPSYNCEKEGMTCYHNYVVQVTKASASKNGSLTTQCTICGKTESNTVIYAASAIKLSKTAYTYNGKEQQPSVTVQDSKGTTLKKTQIIQSVIPPAEKMQEVIQYLLNSRVTTSERSIKLLQ